MTGERELAERLLSLIEENPDDLDQKRVYADYLLQSEDPRGAFMMLQLDIEMRRRTNREVPPQVEREMLALHTAYRRSWLGSALARVLTHVVFVNGFLERAALLQDILVERPQWKEAMADPRLLTLRALERGLASDERYVEIVLSPYLRNIRELHYHLSSQLLDRLVQPGAPPRRMATLVAHARLPEQLPAKFVQHSAFGGLKCLALARGARSNNIELLRRHPTFVARLDEVRLLGFVGRGADLDQLIEVWTLLSDEIRGLSGYLGWRCPWVRMTRTPTGVEIEVDRIVATMSYGLLDFARRLPEDTQLLRLRSRGESDRLLERLQEVLPNGRLALWSDAKSSEE